MPHLCLHNSHVSLTIWEQYWCVSLQLTKMKDKHLLSPERKSNWDIFFFFFSLNFSSHFQDNWTRKKKKKKWGNAQCVICNTKKEESSFWGLLPNTFTSTIQLPRFSRFLQCTLMKSCRTLELSNNREELQVGEFCPETFTGPEIISNDSGAGSQPTWRGSRPWAYPQQHYHQSKWLQDLRAFYKDAIPVHSSLAPVEAPGPAAVKSVARDISRPRPHMMSPYSLVQRRPLQFAVLSHRWLQVPGHATSYHFLTP